MDKLTKTLESVNFLEKIQKIFAAFTTQIQSVDSLLKEALEVQKAMEAGWGAVKDACEKSNQNFEMLKKSLERARLTFQIANMVLRALIFIWDSVLKAAKFVMGETVYASVARYALSYKWIATLNAAIDNFKLLEAAYQMAVNASSPIENLELALEKYQTMFSSFNLKLSVLVQSIKELKELSLSLIGGYASNFEGATAGVFREHSDSISKHLAEIESLITSVKIDPEVKEINELGLSNLKDKLDKVKATLVTFDLPTTTIPKSLAEIESLITPIKVDPEERTDKAPTLARFELPTKKIPKINFDLFGSASNQTRPEKEVEAKPTSKNTLGH